MVFVFFVCFVFLEGGNGGVNSVEYFGFLSGVNLMSVGVYFTSG